MPRRRCVGCGRVAPKRQLVRIALDGARSLAVLDGEQRMAGRGAYICRAGDATAPAPECLQRALQRGGISRTLRCAAPLDRKLVESVGR